MALKVSGRGKVGAVIMPTSSRILQNPLLVKIPQFDNASNAKWLGTQGLIHVSNGLLAPGYIPTIDADLHLHALRFL